MKLGLIGKQYLDTIIYVDSMNLSETNQIHYTEQKLGGMFNISDIDGIEPIYMPREKKLATIISESATSRRTSFVRDVYDTTREQPIDFQSVDWLHVIYIDDVIIDTNKIKKPFSIDFCTIANRIPYIDVINQSKIVFDSRERKHLYKDIITKTPIILHDHLGCEAIIMGQTIDSLTIKPIDGLQVNGAGDIFAGIFIKKYFDHDLTKAIQETCDTTTHTLIEKNNET
tara:strand:+ start:598 stop:1281 length:684 start_codon:yes stop_codon:yes gene_type:complete